MDEKQKPKETETDFKETFWQWVKGENMPNVETAIKEIKLGNDEYLVFKSGAQVNKKLIDDYVVEIPSLNEPQISIESYLEQQKTVKKIEQTANDTSNYGMEKIQEKKDVNNMGDAEIIPHPDDRQELVNWELKYNKPQAHALTQQAQIAKQKDPLLDLIEKSKKKKVPVKISLELEMPSPSFLEILLETYEDKEEIMVDYILQIIKGKNLDKELKNFVKNYIKQ